MVLLVHGKLKGHSEKALEGLVEPLPQSSMPKHVLTVHSLSGINASSNVVVQVANAGSQPVKVYQNMKLGTFTPRKTIFLATSEPRRQCQPAEMSAFDFSRSNLNNIEQQQLRCLLAEFSDLFIPELGKTNLVKHVICTKGPPI